MTTEQDLAKEIMEKAVLAAAEFDQFDQSQTDQIVEAVFRAGFDARVSLAKMAAEETGLGVWQHKVLKNVLATQFVYSNIRHEKTVGELSRDMKSGIVEIAQPMGPIFAITPMTNPTSTTLFKILICLKARNPVIVSPHHRSAKCSGEAARICYEAALKAGAPEYCVQWISKGSRELTHTFMTHPDMALILATGGTGLVTAAYSSGTPAIGVGPGNVPVFVDKSADFPFAVKSILASKTFDNGTVCASEQAVVVEKSAEEKLKEEFGKQGGYFLKPDEIKKVEGVAINPKTGGMTVDIVGQSVEEIARMAGFAVPAGTTVLLAQLEGVGPEEPLSGEVLAPILAFYAEDSYENAVKCCIRLNYRGGIGHTASIYANDEKRIEEFSNLMNAGRVVVNIPSAQGAVGGIFNSLLTSFTLGCGSGGKNITTENISARHLINTKRVCRRCTNERWLAFDTNKYLDEKLSVDDIMNDYNRNF
jgi:acetaldehyde dehydrogenase/alcohol dehydrogenase